MKMPSIECSICSEEFGKRLNSSAVIATTCGHVFHETCLTNWMKTCDSTLASPKTCPECRQLVTMSQTRRIYFNSSNAIDNLQTYVDYLDNVITTKSERIHTASIELERMKLEWTNKIREKDFEIQRLNEKLRSREAESKIQDLNGKIEKLKHKLKDLKQKHNECTIKHHSHDLRNVNENGLHYMQFNYIPMPDPRSARTQSNAHGTLFQMYSPPASTSTVPQTIQTNTNPSDIIVNQRSVFRNPLGAFPGSVQGTNNLPSNLAHQENTFTTNSHYYINTNNQNPFF